MAPLVAISYGETPFSDHLAAKFRGEFEVLELPSSTERCFSSDIICLIVIISRSYVLKEDCMDSLLKLLEYYEREKERVFLTLYSYDVASINGLNKIIEHHFGQRFRGKIKDWKVALEKIEKLGVTKIKVNANHKCIVDQIVRDVRENISHIDRAATGSSSDLLDRSQLAQDPPNKKRRADFPAKEVGTSGECKYLKSPSLAQEAVPGASKCEEVASDGRVFASRNIMESFSAMDPLVAYSHLMSMPLTLGSDKLSSMPIEEVGGQGARDVSSALDCIAELSRRLDKSDKLNAKLEEELADAKKLLSDKDAIIDSMNSLLSEKDATVLH